MKQFAKLLLILLMICVIATEASSIADRITPVLHYKPGELIVRFKDQALASKNITASKSSLLKKFKHFPLHHIKLPLGLTVQDALASYRKDPNVLYAEPNYIVRKAQVPGDTEFSRQWSLPIISAPAAWDVSVGSREKSSVLVAVLDTGIAYYHPDLAANLWINPGEICGDGLDNDGNGIIDDCYGANFGGFTLGDPWDDDTADSHGTHVSGIIGAVGNNELGITGVNWAARIMAVKFLHGPEGMGELADALRGVEYALANGAKIINMSFEVDEDSQSLRDAARAVENAGALMISAAGNTGKNLDIYRVYPASIKSSNNIAVAASSFTDGLPYYSDYGRHTVDIAAPGGSTTGSANAILSTVWLNSGTTLYRTTAGTSMAVPHVTGAAALLWNIYPSLTAVQVKARILNSVDRVPAFTETTISGGRLNLEKALKSQDISTIFDVYPFQLNWNGGTVTVKGVNFGITPSSITLGGIRLPVSSWNDTEISAQIPQNSSNGIIQVNGQGSGFPITVLPTVKLTPSTASGTAPFTAEFNAEVLSGVPIIKYEWDTGDNVFKEYQGITSNFSHTFDAAGAYNVNVRITDSNGNTVTSSATATVSTPSSGGGCFIATAAYGSYLHPKVQILRNFRDKSLLTNRPGRACVRFYYQLSPPVAHLIVKYEFLRVISRWAITPLVLLIQYPFMTLALFILFSICWSVFLSQRTNACSDSAAIPYDSNN